MNDAMHPLDRAADLARREPVDPADWEQTAAGVMRRAQQAMPRVFLDCDRCDDDYVRKEVTFVDHVRNREDADVHYSSRRRTPEAVAGNGPSSSSASVPSRVSTRR